MKADAQLSSRCSRPSAHLKVLLRFINIKVQILKFSFEITDLPPVQTTLG